MKVALVHDYIKEYGGAERVLEALHEIWPEAPVYTTVYLPDFLGPHRNRFEVGSFGKLRTRSEKWEVRTSFLQYLPFKAKLISPIRIIAPWVFRSFDFKDYDVVIVSATGAYSPNLINKSNAIHICYCHTPPRYLYGYATARDWKNNLVFRVLGEIANHFLRLVDFKSAQNVDCFIANSQNVADRIGKFYRRESVMIYPPVGVEVALAGPAARQPHAFPTVLTRTGPPRGAPRLASPASGSPRHDYYLAGGRLARPKHIDLIIEACTKLGVPLKIFGRGFAGYEKEMSNVKCQMSNIQFLGEITDEEKWKLMMGARAYIFASEDEDFGITPVEAMSVGIPVIAYRSGGVVESVVDGKTGLFFDSLTIDSLSNAIKRFNDLNHFSMRENCIKQGKKFSKERFKHEIKDFVKSKIKNQKSKIQIKT